MALKVGFIGAGGMARSHMQGAAACEGANIAGICDINEERAEAATTEFGGAAFTHHRELLKSVKPDAVIICTPPYVHGEVEMDVIEAGIPFLVEKPVALDIDLACSIRDAAEAKGLTTCVGYQLRYLPGIQQMKAYMDNRTVAMIVGHYWSTMLRGHWWSDMSKSGGQIVEQATHIVDLMRYLCGEISEVETRSSQRIYGNAEGITIPDTYVVRFGFSNGTMGSLTTCCVLDEWKIGLDLMLEGTRLHWAVDHVEVTPPKTELPPIEGFASKNIDAVFLEAVRSGDSSTILSPYADAVRTLEITLAANDSAQKNAAIHVQTH